MREFDLIHWLRSRVSGRSDVVTGIGDDCAHLRLLQPSLLVSTDLLVEGVHFSHRWSSPGSVAAKALAANLSDIAAMGGRPQSFVLSLALPPSGIDTWAIPFLEALLDRAADAGLALVGGDLSASRVTTVSMTILGAPPKKGPLLRSTAQQGDRILSLGPLGLSRRGLEWLERHDPDLSGASRAEELNGISESPTDVLAVKNHLSPRARVTDGRCLGESGLVHAMIDVSDGLVSDLGHMCSASGLSGVLDWSALELMRSGLDATMSMDHLLNGGEDYALLFSAAAGSVRQLADLEGLLAQPLVIGHFEAGEPTVLIENEGVREVATPAGYEHFT